MALRSPGSEPIGGEVPALRKGLSVLDLLATADTLSVQEIQARTGLNKTMTFRLLRTLRETGYVRQDPTSRRFSLGLKLLELGNQVSARQDIVTVSRDLLEHLRESSHETANLAIAEDGMIRYLAMAESRQGLRMASHIGSRDSLHSTSIGKAILAYQEAEQRARLTASLDLVARTAKTITDRVSLAEELDRTRRRGYAIDNEENEDGARCVGVPVLDGAGRPLAGLSLAGPSGRITPERAEELAHSLWEASRAISARLNWISPSDDTHGTAAGQLTNLATDRSRA